MHVNRFLRFAFCLFIALSLVACATGGHKGHHSPSAQRVEDSPASNIPMDWYSLSEGREVALKEHKPIMLDFYAPEGCYRCELYAKHIWSNPELKTLVEEEFVLVRVNLAANMTSEEVAIGRKYDYNYDCMLIFLDCTGEIIEEASGGNMCFADFVKPEFFRQKMDHAIAQNAIVVRKMESGN